MFIIDNEVIIRFIFFFGIFTLMSSWEIFAPDMHRVHHSVIIQETDSNFGFNLPWWDRLFGTYHDQPAHGHKEMTLGLANYREKKWLTLPWMLVVPLARRSR